MALGLMGCGGGTVEEGMPNDPNRVDIPLDPKMVDVTGKMGPSAAAAVAKGQAQLQAKQATNPAGAAPAEKKE